MKLGSTVPVACCTALLMVTVPRMAPAASKSLLLDAEAQYASKLCWAAADVLAVNLFYPHCPLTTSTSTATPALFPTSQGLEAGYAAWQGSSATPDPAKLAWFLSSCEANIQGLFCNDWGTPALHGLTFKWGTDPGLDWPTMTQQIDAGRPVLFVWDYPSNGTPPNSPVGLHELVVIGYSDDTGTQQLQIWDPWPVETPLPTQVPACGPVNSVEDLSHSRWIDFTLYTNPVSDMGIGAEHAQDQWDLVPIAVPEPPTGLSVDHGPPPPPRAPLPPFFKFVHPASKPLPEVSFAEARRAVLPQSRQLELRVSGAARSLGVPFPIVGLGFVQLLHAGDDPTGLLAGSTSAVLFPVESQGKVVDAFLMLYMDGRWQVKGYANLGITQRLVQVRARYAAQRHIPLESFYMVSVPGEVAFFAAYGKGKNAILIPASTDPSIKAVAGKPVPAKEQLKLLIRAIQNDLQRSQDRGTDTNRPRQE